MLHRYHPIQSLIGQDLALAPSTLMSWIMRDWDGQPVDSGRVGADHVYEMVRPGVALLRAAGVTSYLDAPWWAPSLKYSLLEACVAEALDDLAVAHLVVLLETPGGVCGGLLSSTQRFRRLVAKRGIPVSIHTGQMCTSAGAFLAQSIAGSGGRITAETVARVGQMGVYRLLHFIPRRLAEDGIDIRYVAAGSHKIDLFPEMEPDEGALSREQGQINAVYEALCRDAAIGLAGRRGMSPDEAYQLIREQDSRTYIGDPEAIQYGVIDAVSTLDDVLDAAAAA